MDRFMLVGLLAVAAIIALAGAAYLYSLSTASSYPYSQGQGGYQAFPFMYGMMGWMMGSHHAQMHGGVGVYSQGSARSGEELGEPSVEFTLRTRFVNGGFFFEGVGGDINGVANPTLRVKEGEVIRITLINGDGVVHNLAVPELGAYSSNVASVGEKTSVAFRAEQGEYAYFCTIPGHREAGMIGKIIVEEVD